MGGRKPNIGKERGKVSGTKVGGGKKKKLRGGGGGGRGEKN